MNRLSVTMLLALILCLPAWSVQAAVKAQPMAVLISAEWCINCKLIEPKLAQLRDAYEGKLRFVSLDVTDDARLELAQERAEKLGIGDLLQGEFATGWVALFDRHGRKVGELHQQMSVDEMRKTLNALVARPG